MAPSAVVGSPSELRRRASVRREGGLAALLRETTREAHLAAEAAFALDARLAGLDAYAGLLVGLRDFYGPVEAALSRLEGWDELSPAIDIGGRRRAALLDEDLERLGVPVAAPAPIASLLPLPSFPHGLGCLYVLEGSALGGRIVARRARAVLGAELPLAFLTSAGRFDLGADWRALQIALDRFGLHGRRPETSRRVVAGALATFAALTDGLRETPRP